VSTALKLSREEWLRSIGIEEVTAIRFQPTLLTEDAAAVKV
jgi:hypothetical protein